MKKKSLKKIETKTEKFVGKAGEVIGTIGYELHEGKEKVVDVSHTVMEGISKMMKPAKKKAAKKVVKKAAKKITKKVIATKKTVKKQAKKIAKKTPAKKILKKVKKAAKKK